MGIEERYAELLAKIQSSQNRQLPSWSSLTAERRANVELVLRRLALARFLQNDEALTDLDRYAGHFEDTALRLYLLLTCLEPIALLQQRSEYVPFVAWLETTKEPAKSAAADAIGSALAASDNSIAKNADLRDAVRRVHRSYLDSHGARSNFLRFFEICLDVTVSSAIIAECWVCAPSMAVAALHIVPAGYSASSPPALRQLAEARARWDGRTPEEQLREVAEACYEIRNGYTHALIPTFSTGDRVPAFARDLGPGLDRGEAIYLRDRVLASKRVPMTLRVEEWIESALCNCLALVTA